MEKPRESPVGLTPGQKDQAGQSRHWLSFPHRTAREKRCTACWGSSQLPNHFYFWWCQHLQHKMPAPFQITTFPKTKQPTVKTPFSLCCKPRPISLPSLKHSLQVTSTKHFCWVMFSLCFRPFPSVQLFTDRGSQFQGRQWYRTEYIFAFHVWFFPSCLSPNYVFLPLWFKGRKRAGPFNFSFNNAQKVF